MQVYVLPSSRVKETYRLSGLDQAAPKAGVGNAPTVEGTEPPLPLDCQLLPQGRLLGGG